MEDPKEDFEQEIHDEFVNKITDTEVPEWLAILYAEQAWDEHPESPLNEKS